ncbi:MAG: selenide,water dikinase [Arenicella sp.]|jgi:selenide,water dikinase
MFTKDPMFTKDLVLLGGGHTHVLLIKALAMKAIAGVRVTLVSEKLLTPYSGMLPGFVAGHYSLAETNIDLNQLCRRAGVRWIQARCNGVDPDLKCVYLQGQADIEFDVLSIDIGSTPDQRISGASEFAVGVKPIAGFQRRWGSLLQSLGSEQTNQPLGQQAVEKINWGVIGAGAGGVELVLAMAHRLRGHQHLQFHLIYRGEYVLPGYPDRVVRQVEQSLRDYNVTTHAGFSVAEVTSAGVINDAGEDLSLDERIWCTGAVGAPWLNAGSLAHTEKNFIQVSRTLQSTSHESVFAVGDIAEMVDDPRPKAGVFAVRQAPYLEQNLRRLFSGQALQEIKLQKNFLSLLALGGQVAVASRNGLAVKGRWVWRWKDSIDQAFMRQFTELPMAMPESMSELKSRSIPATPSRSAATESSTVGFATESSTAGFAKIISMPCGGCASKLGPELLAANLAKLANDGSHQIEDAALWAPTPGALAVQTIDGFRSFLSDESRFAQICVNHALSDIYAMGANAINIQAWINLAFSSPNLQRRDHLRMLRGIQSALSESKATLSGGHSSEGIENHLGIVANGEVAPGAQWNKSGVQPGDLILLSKALGTGVVMAADMQGQANAAAVQASYASMLLSNHHAMQQLQNIKPNAVTDVTGFGLIGHLLEMLDSASQRLKTSLVAELNLTDIALLSGALELAEAGWRSSLYPQLEPYLLRVMFADQKDPAYSVDQRGFVMDLLLDPQTSGGLLVTMDEASATVLLSGRNDYVVIGTIIEKASSMPELVSINIVG